MQGLHPEPETREPLENTTVHDILSSERRQLLLELLREGEIEEMSLRALSERIAEIETGESPPPRNIRQSVYVSLHQTHLPKLDDLDIVDYDQQAKTISIDGRIEEVSVYMETVPKYGISWSEYYLGLSMCGLLLLAGTAIGVPLIASIDGGTWGAILLIILAVSATYQTIQQGSSILHRVHNNSE